MFNLTDAILSSSDFKAFEADFKAGTHKHSYLVVSQDSALRTAFVNELAVLILGGREMVLAGSHPDLTLVSGNAKGNIIVEDVLLALDKIFYKPSISENKVFIINAKTSISERVQNKLLKTLEEPPANTIILVSVPSLAGVINTVQSRCEKLILKPLSAEALANLGYNQEVILKSERELSLCEKFTLEGDKFKLVEDCLTNLKKSSQIIEYSRKLSKTKEEASEYLNYFAHIFNLLIKDNLSSSNTVYPSALVAEFPLMVLSECATMLDAAKQKLEANCQPGLVIDEFLFKMLEVKYLCKNNI